MKRHLLKQRYIVALASENDAGALQPLASFMTNPAGSAIVNAAGAIDKAGPVVQVQLK